MRDGTNVHHLQSSATGGQGGDGGRPDGRGGWSGAVQLGAGTEASLLIDIVFWALAVSSIVAALAVVMLRDVFRAALFLVVALLGAAGLFVLMRAEFLAVVQVLIYVGAISVLIIFAVVTTRDVEQGSPFNRLKVPALVIAGLLLASVIFVVFSTDWILLEDSVAGGQLSGAAAGEIERVYDNTIPGIAGLLITDYVLAFEIASVVLLAAVVGALAILRRR